MRRPSALWLPVLLSLALVGGCASSTRIAEVKTDPGRFHDKRVSVVGVVTSSWSVPLLPLRIYRVDDGSGELTVVSRSGRTPARGARVRVSGRVEDIAMIAGQPIGLHVVEDDVRFMTM